MAISPSHYAVAFRSALREGDISEEVLVGNLRQVVNQRGQTSLWPRIVERVSQELVRHHGGRWVVVETARALTSIQRERVTKVFSKKDYISEHVRPDLVSGIRILVDGEREFDGSLKRKLDKLLS